MALLFNAGILLESGDLANVTGHERKAYLPQLGCGLPCFGKGVGYSGTMQTPPALAAWSFNFLITGHYFSFSPGFSLGLLGYCKSSNRFNGLLVSTGI